MIVPRVAHTAPRAKAELIFPVVRPFGPTSFIKRELPGLISDLITLSMMGCKSGVCLLVLCTHHDRYRVDHANIR
jgi:hypothetical protein